MDKGKDEDGRYKWENNESKVKMGRSWCQNGQEKQPNGNHGAKKENKEDQCPDGMMTSGKWLEQRDMERNGGGVNVHR